MRTCSSSPTTSTSRCSCIAIRASSDRGRRCGATVPTARDRSTAISPLASSRSITPFIGASAIDEEGALLDFDYREYRPAQASSPTPAASCWSRTDKAPAQRAGAHRPSQPIQTFVPMRRCPPGLPASAPSGIEVVEAMDKPEADYRRAGRRAASTVTRLGWIPTYCFPDLLRAEP